jgi:hypothetical protein
MLYTVQENHTLQYRSHSSNIGAVKQANWQSRTYSYVVLWQVCQVRISTEATISLAILSEN